ncbi:uroporphyrinogen-III C-methyltransferase [Conexibacter sp. CPCC 206217]|uniref:uroporphyrinogen-III C-methyltransferase n=1 Tax=Conexibacter sp. CPCC 206217 TaxID=3064574 RepID=UPI0027238DC3|nr:uroporphyrinogen-III C-methyltransferase [Conexibacter sp. CPCC 206217]MDO8211529.1 uroporphyrinogen-III C-methyltransferase [Conexibacter sp. CPCC 206217]
MSAPGRVYLVGAGPGDIDLLTGRAYKAVVEAEVILYDRLIPPGLIDHAHPDAELIYVGKEGRGPSMPQAEIDRLLVEHGRAGKRVVRLKGGDPFVFGRGGEEALLLREAGIPFEVVPGITSGIAAPAYAGIPVTHRDRASAVALITGHEDPAKPESAIDWPALAAFPGTLVFYMGIGQLPRIAERLIAAGRDADEPAAVIERGTLPDQRTVVATLSTIAERAAAEGFRPPSITLVGSVAALREEGVRWFEERPLAGRSVAVTRARAQASGLATRLRALGAVALETPAIKIVPVDVGVALDPSGYDLVCLTSPNGVRLLFERLAAGGRDARALAGATVAAIGPGTARALREHGVVADVVPERFVAESLVEALAGVPVRRALVARARVARDVLPDALRARGAEVDVVELYETVAEQLDAGERAAAGAADYVTFTSSSTVRFFLDALGGADAISPRTRLVSIGPVTSATLREHGLEPHVEASEHDVDGVVAALLADAAS